MTIQEHVHGTVAVIAPVGRLTDETAPLLTQRIRQLLGAGAKHVLLDLDAVPYLDSAGVGVIAQIHVSACRLGGGCKLIHVKPRKHRALTVTRLLTVLEAYESEEDASRGLV